MKIGLIRTLILLLMYVLIPVVFISMYFFGNLYSLGSLLEPYNLSIIAGAGAYIVFMSQFLLSARLKVLERVFGQDRLLGLHGVVGFTSGALIVSHFILKYLLILRYGDPTPQSALGFLALLTFAVLAPAAYLILQGRRPRVGPLDYRKVRFGHNLFALAGLAIVVHVMLASSTWSVLLRSATLVWGVITLGAYVWHKILRPAGSVRMQLTEAIESAPGVHRYRFAAATGRGSAALLDGRRSGQFAYFRFEGTSPGREEHPFTISSPPGEEMEIYVRDSGDFTGQMNRIPSGTRVRLDGPYGRFHPFNLADGTPLLFLAGGIGITPFLSMARDSALRHRHPVTIVWSITSPEDEPVAAPLAKLATAGQIDMRIVYTRKAPSGTAVSRIDGRLIGELLKNIAGDMSDHKNAIQGHPGSTTLADVACFLCGPGRFVREISAELRRQGVRKSRIFSERFSW